MKLSAWARYPGLLAIAAGLTVAAAVALPLRSGGGVTVGTGAPSVTKAHPVAFFDEQVFANAAAQAEGVAAQPMPGVRALIVPHHWAAGHLIMRGLRDLAATGETTRIVVIGPDHVNSGSAPATTSDLPWQTPYGRLTPDAALIERLVATEIARADPDALSHEHSVAGLVHAIAYYLPDVEIVPLALRHDISRERIAALALALAEEDVVLVAAVDFSHYLSAPEAEARDAETIAALNALDSSRLLTFGDEHLDSAPAIALAIEFAEQTGDAQFVLRENTNSGILSGSLAPPVTSYITGYFLSSAD